MFYDWGLGVLVARATNHVVRRLELSVHSLISREGRERGWKLSLITNKQ